MTDSYYGGPKERRDVFLDGERVACFSRRDLPAIRQNLIGKMGKTMDSGLRKSYVSMLLGLFDLDGTNREATTRLLQESGLDF